MFGFCSVAHMAGSPLECVWVCARARARVNCRKSMCFMWKCFMRKNECKNIAGQRNQCEFGIWKTHLGISTYVVPVPVVCCWQSHSLNFRNEIERNKSAGHTFAPWHFSVAGAAAVVDTNEQHQNDVTQIQQANAFFSETWRSWRLQDTERRQQRIRFTHKTRSTTITSHLMLGALKWINCPIFACLIFGYVSSRDRISMRAIMSFFLCPNNSHTYVILSMRYPLSVGKIMAFTVY